MLLQKEKERRRGAACMQLLLVRVARRATDASLRKAAAFSRWQMATSSAVPPRQLPLEEEEQDQAAHRVEAEARLREELIALQRCLSSSRAVALCAAAAGCLRTHCRRRLCQALLHWKRATSRGHLGDNAPAPPSNGSSMGEQLLLEAERKFDELKKKSDAYQASVKAHWAKTELYMTKLKGMVGEEKQKRKVLKEEKGRLAAEVDSLKLQLEATRRERSQLDFETVRRMIYVQKTLSGGSEGDSGSGGTGARSSLLSLGRSPTSGGPPMGLSPSRSPGEYSERPGSLARSLSMGLCGSPLRSVAGLGLRLSTPPRSQAGELPPPPSTTTPPQPHSPSAARPPRPSANSLPSLAKPSDSSGRGVDGANHASASTQTDADARTAPLASAVGEEDVGTEIESRNYPVSESADDTAEGPEEFDYHEYAQQWETLYAQAQEQLASETYAKEEAQRAQAFLQEQLAALQAEDAQEKELLGELMVLVEASAGAQAASLAQLEQRVVSIAGQGQARGAGEKGRGGGASKRAGGASCRITRRASLSSIGGSEDSTYGSVTDGSGWKYVKAARGHHQTYLLDKAQDEGAEESIGAAKRTSKRIAFSANITQLDFGKKRAEAGAGSDAESDDSSEEQGHQQDVEMPVLPDMNFSAILEQIEEESEAEQRQQQQQQQQQQQRRSPSSRALEAAMSAKIPKARGAQGAGVSGAMTHDESVHNLGASGRDSSGAAPVNEHDPMDYVWQSISGQQQQNPAASDSSSNVRVAIRMRPLNSREVDLQAAQCVEMLSGTDLRIEDEETTMQNKFSFDYCFDARCSDPHQAFAGNQQQVFDKLGLEVLTNAWHGYNASLFAYGQTGSGKSYSMMGSDADPGIIPRVCMALFYLIRRHYEKVEGEIEAGSKTEPSDRQFSVEASYLEIYNERIRDLLDPGRTNLKVREHPHTGVFVENLSTCAVESYKDVSDLLEMGLEQRTTASTNMNSESSRSHSVFTIVIRMQSLLASGKKAVRLCKLCLVDLAGSERAASTGATGARLKEGANINRSLSTLGRCISALAKAAGAAEGDKINIPFRESVLTWLLRESLCGNAKTAMLATVSPADVSYGETMSTLRYANSAKMIATKAVVNEDPTTKIINELRNEVLRLRKELQLGGGSGATSSPTRGGGGGASDGGVSSKHLNEKMKEHLLAAESALHTYAKAWESKEVSVSAAMLHFLLLALIKLK
jgi:hypothetical protein